MDIDLAGERVELLAGRALLWRGTLVIADPHFGKTAALRAMSIPLPGGTTTSDTERLGSLIETTGAQRLIVLGDLLHARQGRAPRTLDVLRNFRGRHAKLEFILVRGNHDRHAGDPPAELGIECVDPGLAEPPFIFRHEPCESGQGYTIAGQIHPAVRLRGRARESLRLPCFWFGPRVGVLPAFGSFTGSAEIRPGPDDRVYVIAGELLELQRPPI
jgi:DNA ligase-associated metallophosphoesterase